MNSENSGKKKEKQTNNNISSSGNKIEYNQGETKKENNKVINIEEKEISNNEEYIEVEIIYKVNKKNDVAGEKTNKQIHKKKEIKYLMKHL